jgi:Tol biopolymer transport system component
VEGCHVATASGPQIGSHGESLHHKRGRRKVKRSYVTYVTALFQALAGILVSLGSNVSEWANPSKYDRYPVDAARVHQQLDRILASPEFESADRLSRLLRYLVRNALEHPGDTVKEYALGIDVFDRKPDFDPKVDSVVRVQTGRLRQKLAKYYSDAGIAEPVHIEVPRGGYIAIISVPNEPDLEPHPPAPTPKKSRLRLLSVIAALVSLAGIAFAVLARITRGSAPVIAQFTSDLGIEDDAAFSPDGESIVYSGTSELGRDIFIKSVREGRVRRLTDDRAVNVHPSWSPDGSAIAFARANDPGYGIWLIPSQGGAGRRIGDTQSAILDEFSVGPVWTRDGRFVIVSDRPGVTGPDSLFLLDVSTGARKRVTHPLPNDIGDCAPAISPSGGTIAFARFTTFSTGDIYTVPIGGGPVQQVTKDRAAIRGLDFAPDGQSLVFSSSRGGTQRLWRVGLPHGAPEPFASPGLNAMHPAVARAGRRLVYTEWQSNTNIWRVDLSGRSNAAAPLIASTRQQDSPRYSPDGTRIAFVSNRSGNPEIWASDADGQNVRRLTRFDGPLVGSPRWSPDSRWIAFDSRAQGRSNVYLVSADGTSTRRITDADADRMMPSWSRDGKSLFVSLRSNGLLDLWRLPVDGGAPLQITHDRGVDAAEVPGRDLLIFTKQHVTGFWSVGADGSGERRIPELAGIDAHRCWTVSRQGMYFASGGKVPYQVLFFDFETHQTREVATISGRLFLGTPSLDVSPDGRYLLYSQVGQR